jgi:hypothetical protein
LRRDFAIWHGRGTAVDLPEAFVWLSLAARRSIPNAREACDELKTEMTQEQMEDAMQRLNLVAPAQAAAQAQVVVAEPEAEVKIESN